MYTGTLTSILSLQEAERAIKKHKMAKDWVIV